MEQWKNQGSVKYTENIEKITKDVRVAERKKAEAAAPSPQGGCCSTDGNGHGGSCGCGDSHGNGHGKQEALVQLLPVK
jgi:hypothetical protein